MRRYELHDSQWRHVEELMPQRQHAGQSPNDFRKTFNGILWVLHSGAPWRDLPSFYGPWQSVYHTCAGSDFSASSAPPCLLADRHLKRKGREDAKGRCRPLTGDVCGNQSHS